jgi:DMSO/TMAO reductase YedYZ molybdopterin-dependent catalytic subunit
MKMRNLRGMIFSPISRRDFLRIGGLSLATLLSSGILSTCRQQPNNEDLSFLINSNPAEVDNSTLPIIPVERLHVIGSYNSVVDIANYHVTIDGMVNTQMSISYDALMCYPTVTDTVLLICPGVFADNAKWTGIPLTRLLAESGLHSQAQLVTIYALDGYYASLSIDKALSGGVFLAYEVNDQVLPKDNGYPLRMVVTGEYGAIWVKWVERIEVK